MSSDEIFNILTHLHKLECPTEILGCNPEKISNHEKSSITEASKNTLLQESNERYELIKWIDSKIFKKEANDSKNDIEERLSLILSSEGGNFFSPISQNHKHQLMNWWILIRTLYSSEKIIKNEDIEKQFEKSRRYMQYLAEQGCAKPISNRNNISQITSKKAPGDKTTGLNSKSLIIPRDLEKLIRTGKNRQLDASQLKTIRDNVTAEVNSIPKEKLDVDTSPHFKSTELNEIKSQSVPKLPDAMEQFEKACTSFDSLYSHDLKGWVDRMPKVETNSNLEQTTEKLRKLLSNIHDETEAISTIRASCNGIAVKSRQLDTLLSQPRSAEHLADIR